MSTVYTATVNGITWNYKLSGSAPNQRASIGDGTTGQGNATTLGTGLSGNPLIIPADLGGNPVTAIDRYAFYNCDSILSVTIPNSVTSIGIQAFESVGLMTSITLPNLLTSINDGTFKECSSLRPMTIPNSVTYIGAQSFMSCGSLTSITIPNSVTSIGLGAFYACGPLTSVTMGNSVRSIGTSAFYGMGNTTVHLTAYINIPNSVTSIASDAFTSSSQNLIVTMNSKTISGTTFTSPTAPGPDVWFFGNSYVTLVLPPPPSMTITSTTTGVTSGSTTNNASIALTFTSSDTTTNFVVGNISVTNGALSDFTGSGSVYNATFTPTIAGVCTIKVNAGVFTDGSQNNTASNTFTWTFDNVAPTMIIESTTPGVTSGSTTNNTSIALRFTSSKATTNFAVGDISVTNGTISAFVASSSTVYTAIFMPTVVGLCTIGVAAGVYTDTLGNSNTVATTFNLTSTYTVWNIDPSANHIIKSYVKDFVDVSGMVMLRENSNLYINGNTETAGNLSLNRLFVTADASFNRRIFVGGDVSMNSNVAVSGDLSMNGTVTKCSFNNSSVPKTAFSGTVPDGADYTSTKIVYDQTFQANDDVSMNGATFASNNVIVSGNIVFGDGTVMNTYDNNILSTNPTVFKSSTFTALDICGNLVAGSYATSSDYRIKTNVVELDETYTVDKLRPVKYFQTQINREKYGLIAHELQEHYPDLVIGEKDGSELQRVNYTGLIAIIINEIKRLKQNLAELESGI